MKEAIIRAIAAAGGASALGRYLGISHAAVLNWDRCPAERVLAVETACNKAVTRYELRPDVFGKEPPESVMAEPSSPKPMPPAGASEKASAAE